MKKLYTALGALLLTAVLASCAQTEAPVNAVTRIDSPFAIPEGESESDATDTEEIKTTPAPETTAAPETEPVTEAVTEPPIPEVKETARISFLAAGDNVIHKCIWMDAERRAVGGSEYNFKPMYGDTVDFISSFDLAFINQETMLGGVELGLSSYPNFNSPKEVGTDLKEIGFDIINIATNHMIDFGTAGLQNTIDFLNSDAMSGVTVIGGYENAEDYDNIRTVEREGVSIALLSYTYGTNGHSLPASSELVIPRIKDADIIRQCALAEDAGDVTVVSIHWGNENQTTPTAEQKRVAKLLAENGADIILGHHSHVLQPIEWIETEHGRTLCIYSLGNLVSAMADWENMVGGFFTFDIVAYSDGTVTAESPAFVPTAFYFGPNYFDSRLYFLKDYSEELANKHATYTIYGASYASPERMTEFAENIMGDYLKMEP